MEYRDFTEYPNELLREGKTNDMVRVSGIARACDIVLWEGRKCVVGMLELGKGKFVEISGKIGASSLYTTKGVERFLKTSSESNQEIQVKGLYNKSDNVISVHSLKLGNLEMTLSTKLGGDTSAG